MPYILNDNFSVVDPFEPDPDKRAELIDEIKTFGDGGCVILAGRIHQITGWKVLMLKEADPNAELRLRCHFVVCDPVRRCVVDAYGSMSDVLKALIPQRYDISVPRWVFETEPGSLTAMEPENLARVDAFLETAWMKDAVPPERRISPINYDRYRDDHFDEDEDENEDAG